ncbi:MAG: hypothetical protein HYV09_14080 [Deltaproteobacteria bacterium]|nr:hypothetical protein [Deltaproteobacteria bacterium]
MRLAGLFFLSAVVLAFEVFLTRLVSYTVDLMLMYVVLGIAMLGSGAAGSLVALRSGWLSRERVGEVLALAAAAFSISLVIAPAIFVRLTPTIAGPIGAVSLALVMTAPFLASGVAVTLALASSGEGIGRAYAADLGGAAVGCFLPLALLGPLDGARFLSLLVGIALVAAVAYFRAAGLRLRSAPGAVLLSAVAGFALTVGSPGRAYPIQADPHGQANVVRKQAADVGIHTTRLFERWDPTGHVSIDGYSAPGGPTPYPYCFYAQDGTAGSMLVRWSGADASAAKGSKHEPVPVMCTETIYGQAYASARQRVLVIGLGGAPDVQCALYHGAEQVDAVEINRTTIRAITGELSDFLGGIGTNPRVRVHARDGRSFAHGSRGAGYDLIQLSGVDTKQVIASGALALSENHLYTEEAFEDYLASLAPDGILSIVRFGQPEQLRLINTAVHALRAMGAEHPERHIVAIDNGFIIGVLVRRQPFPPHELDAIAAHFSSARPVDPVFRPFFMLTTQRPTLAYLPGRPAKEPFARFLADAARSDTAAFEASYAFDISPTFDDRPFFFHLYPSLVPMSLLPFQILYGLLAAVIVLALVLILVPALRLRRRSGEGAPAGIAWFFLWIGAGFLLVEVWLIHRFGLYLGHQTYAMSVVLGSLLLGTGAGALFGERMIGPPARRVRIGVSVIVVLGAVGVFVLPRALDATWALPLAVRGGLVFAFVFLLGLVMGFPFPAGLRWLVGRHPAAAPWCIGINWFASVMASVAVTPLAMRFGYTFLLACGMGAYVVAALVMRAAGRHGRAAAAPGG